MSIRQSKIVRLAVQHRVAALPVEGSEHKACFAAGFVIDFERWLDEKAEHFEREREVFTGDTAQAVMLLAASNNDNAYADACGEAPKDSSVAACWALIADVWEHLEARRDEWAHDDEEPPPCLASMGCLCICHAAGLATTEPCDTSEERARQIAADADE